MAIASNRLSDEEYEKNFSDIHPPFQDSAHAIVEANRCLFCYDAPCTKLCPTSIDVPQFIKQISSGNIKGSAKTILSSNILGAGCARVCPVEKLCEGACVYNLKDEKPISIAQLQRHATEKAIEEKWKVFKRKPSNGKKIAIVGAGPSGLSCAHALSLEGCDVTIYEKESETGGLMAYGVAAYKVDKAFCKNETDFILSLGGIKVKYNQELGKQISIVELQSSYDAVYLAFGVGVARKLEIPGEQSEGVVDAIDFIHQLRTNQYKDVRIGEKVIVIGLGMTAIDAATQAIRLGASDVTLVYRRTENEKPCSDAELKLARLDGCKIIWLSSPKEIIAENGPKLKLICERLKLGKPDESGRATPEKNGETFSLEADMIIKATGQAPFSDLVKSLSITNDIGKIRIRQDGSTNLKGLFAGGDNVNGGREVVHAVQAGKDAAIGILKYLFS